MSLNLFFIRIFQEKQEQRRQAMHQSTMQQHSAPGRHVVPVAPPQPPVSNSGGTDSSVILTDADFDKLGLDVLSEGFHQQLPLGEAFPGSVSSSSQQQQPIMSEHSIEHTYE